MTNKSTIKKLLSHKAIVTVILMVLVASSIYTFVHKKDSDSQKSSLEENVELVIKPSGLDVTQPVKNIGDVEKVIAKWVEVNPEAIIQSVVAMQQKAAEKQQKDAQKNISTKQNELLKTKSDPVYAPKGYNVSVIQFFDYNCGYCKKAQQIIEDLIAQDKKVRIIFKELPILGASSAELSKVAIAVNMTDETKYVPFHNALMKSNAKTKDEAITIAKSVGVDEKKLEKALENKRSEIESQIKINQDLAGSIGVNGTPAFVVGGELIPGAVDIKTLKDKIATERKK